MKLTDELAGRLLAEKAERFFHMVGSAHILKGRIIECDVNTQTILLGPEDPLWVSFAHVMFYYAAPEVVPVIDARPNKNMN